jgi:alkanesulfonate monooxygenase SsuD/methylene tetrahydromethanopterin reductase-like flavin-dependent oxidoreductase (luciferase family)
VQFGAHLPLIDFQGRGWRPGGLSDYVRTAGELGFSAIAANDHFLFSRPWLDGIVALSSVIGERGSMDLVTTVALPVLRGPVALAKTAAAIDLLSGGRLVLGVGAGSSARDYEAAGIPFEERWQRLDKSIAMLRDQLSEDPRTYLRAHYGIEGFRLEPRPMRPQGPPIFIGAWGSSAGLRRVARLGDGWLASAYNTTPVQLAEGRGLLASLLSREGRQQAALPCWVSTMWTYVTRDESERARALGSLANVLNRPAEQLRDQVLVGAPEECAARLRALAEAGVERIFIWPLREEDEQLRVVMGEVAPLVQEA